MATRKQCLVAILAIMISAAGAGQAYADGFPIFFSFGGEKVVKVADFPNTEEWKTQDGKYLDAGYRYKQVTIFFVPVWNYGGEWCGYIGQGDYYLNLNKSQLDSYATEAGVRLPDAPKIPFWQSYGGKILVAGFLLLGGFGKSKASG